MGTQNRPVDKKGIAPHTPGRGGRSPLSPSGRTGQGHTEICPRSSKNVGEGQP